MKEFQFMQDHKFIFIGGLHRSGKTLLFRCLQEHPLISGFRKTGVQEDEGQHLQSVYPPARFYGGPGKFGFKQEAHLTEASSLASEENSIKLFSEWSQYWDSTKPFLLEASPPNLIRSRFLQRLFPNSYFIILVRHPVAVSLATQKWSKTTLHSLLKHWILCHEIFQLDAPHLKNVMVIKYEHLVARPHSTLEAIYSFLSIDNYPSTMKVDLNINQTYFARWRQLRHGLVSRFYFGYLIATFEERVNNFGYSLSDLELANSEGILASFSH
jgi:hypothetical protein